MTVSRAWFGEVGSVASLLPLLLQFALLLFLIGFSIFLHGLNPLVAWITTGIMIVWFMAFTFTALTPAFSSQCPYKTSILKGFLTKLRSLPMKLAYIYHNLISGIYHRIPVEWHAINAFIEHLYNSSMEWPNQLRSLEEDQVYNEDILNLSTIMCIRDVLQGEKLSGPTTHCFQDVTIQEINELFHNKQGQIYHGLLPKVASGNTEGVRSLTLDLLGDNTSQVMLGGEGCNPSYYHKLYIAVTKMLSGAYNPEKNKPIPDPFLLSFIHLIQNDPTSAAFCILTMYSVRKDTTNQHPNIFDPLFSHLSETQIQTYGIGKA